MSRDADLGAASDDGGRAVDATPRETACLSGAGMVALALLMIPSNGAEAQSRNSDVVLGLLLLIHRPVAGHRHDRLLVPPPPQWRQGQVELAAADGVPGGLADRCPAAGGLAITAQEHTDLDSERSARNSTTCRRRSLPKILKEVGAGQRGIQARGAPSMPTAGCGLSVPGLLAQTGCRCPGGVRRQLRRT